MIERPRILVVGADPIQRLGLRTAVEQGPRPADVVEAASAADVHSLLAAGIFDCMLVDEHVLPAGGVALVADARMRGVSTPIVFVCGMHDEDVLQRAADAGVTDFLPRGDLSPRRLALRIQFAIRSNAVDQEQAHSLTSATAAAHARDEVLAIVSHDLRGPLHAISLAAEALRDEVQPGGERYLGAIDRAIGRAERLIADLLDASAVENGALALTRSAVNINSVVRQAAADHELAAKESGGSLRAIVPSEPIVVSADRERLLQVLSNLIGNSLKHAKGTPIELAVDHSATHAVVTVRDHGPGITATELPHVFDRYWSGSKAARRGGAGLGLAIAKGIVSAHGGTIGVESAGEGALFTFTLPLATI